ncbi:MAG: proline dehydrogenase [bacterium]|nr:proline dehydrogenase [bacterium]
MRRFAARYIAGETVDEALEHLASLAARGHPGVIDILGEDVESEAEARAALAGYRDAADRVARQKLDAYVSIKPTHFGLRLSPDLAHELYSELLERCRELGQFARVEMEDHTTIDATLALFARLRERFDNVGIVLQSRLLRTLDDIDALGEVASDVRMVKGIYLEPPEIAHTDAQAIRDAFLACTERLFQRGHTVALATHDEHLAGRLLRLAADRGVDASRHYFEVLLGVQEPLWNRWRQSGNTVRVYVPYGLHWRAYSQRRMKKNPEILRHVMRGMLPW